MCAVVAVLDLVDAVFGRNEKFGEMKFRAVKKRQHSFDQSQVGGSLLERESNARQKVGLLAGRRERPGVRS